MATYLDDILDPDNLGVMIDEGYIQVRYHPEFPYGIYCYTKKAMFDREWNNETMTCRGLIVNENSGEILARPFKKFFNYGEPSAPIFKPDDWVTVYDKVDGSLGIAYDTPNGPAIATKGSFVSEQAVHATELLRSKYPRYQTDDYCTDLFEIIYPENRIVLDYGETDELRYLGSVVVDTGHDYWNGILMTHFGIPKNMCILSGEYEGVMKAIDLSRPNAEGVVIVNDDTGERLKLKQEDYLELHKVMTGLNERQLWQWAYEGKEAEEILASLPEELHDWATPILVRLLTQYNGLVTTVNASFAYHKKRLPDRKAFASAIKDYPPLTKGCLFLMADGRFDRVEELIWKALKP